MAGSSGLMAGKRGLIVGVANNRSIAWGIAKACADHGAEIALTYQGDAFKKRVEPLAAELGALVAGHCDVTDVASLDAVFAVVAKSWGRLDFLVHAVAFSDKDELTGRYVETTRDNFLRTMDISVYSLTAMAKRAEPLMSEGGSILTLTYYGAEKVMPHYARDIGHRRLPLHPEMERIQFAAQAHRDARGGRHVRPLSAVGHGPRRDR